MSDFWFFFLGVFVGMFILGMAFANRPKRRHVPTVLGSPVPLVVHTIDFTRRFNISTDGADRYGEGGGGTREFRAARIVGYVGAGPEGVGKFYQEWIVLALPEGRKFYLSPHSIRVLEELPDPPAV